jgi:hypothetical protein
MCFWLSSPGAEKIKSSLAAHGMAVDFNDYRVDQNQESGYFFRDQMNTAVRLNGNGHLPLG